MKINWDYKLDPPEEFCYLCRNLSGLCECNSIDGIGCQYCEKIFYDGKNEPSWTPCECGKTIYDFIEKAPKPGIGYVLKYPDPCL